ncbi:MAG: integrase arm-type DNA-binding domain-containing protein [Pseudomonadota bacterium]
MSLTELKIRALKPKVRTYKVADTQGLFLEVNPGGSKLWRCRYRHLGKDKRISIGSFPDVGLAEARRKRDDVRRAVHDGIDPLAERKRERLVALYNAANSFGDVAREYIDKMVAEGRAVATTTKANWLLEQFAPISRRPIADLKPVDVLAALKRIEAQGKHETARRCRSFASRVFRYAAATGRAETDPTSVLRGALIAPKTMHHSAILDPDGVGELLRSIDAYTGHAITRIAMQISPHLMARPGEIRQAQWSEFDLTNAVWNIPAERMKMRRPHSVPLSRQVMACLVELSALTGPKGFVFPAFHTSLRPLSENTINQAFRRMGYAVGEVTAHGLRTTASTLLNESGKWRPDAIERSLAHADTDSVRGTYNRGDYWDERVAMHQWWSDYLDELRQRVPMRACA